VPKKAYLTGSLFTARTLKYKVGTEADEAEYSRLISFELKLNNNTYNTVIGYSCVFNSTADDGCSQDHYSCYDL